MENSNIVPKGNGNKMMSSKQIAERTNKEHKNVLRDIRNMIDELEQKDGSNMYLNDYQIVKNLTNGYTLEIRLSEKLCLCLASGYSITLRMQIIEDWEDLKKQQIETRKLPTNFVEALKELVASEEKIILLEVENKKLKPRDEFVTKVFETNDLLDIGEVAKILKLNYGRNTLYAVLKEKGIFFKTKNEPYQEYINKGYFELKESLITKTQPPKTIVQTFATQKGLGFIAKKLGVITI